MPRIPKWIGDTFETVLSSQMHRVTVSGIKYLAPELKLIRFEGNFSRIDFSPGQVVQLRVSDTEYRHYTLSLFDNEAGVCEVLFYLHDKGPGSQWAAKLELGEQIKFRGPGGRLTYNESAKYHFMFGDETSIGLFQGMKEIIHNNGQEYICVLELEKEYAGWPNLTGLSAEVVAKTQEFPAKEAIRILNTVSAPESVFWEVWRNATFYLTGNAKSIQSFRKALKQHGIGGRQIRTEPYWAEGKAGL